MKLSLTIKTLLQAYSYRLSNKDEKGQAPIDALCCINMNALACNRAKTIRNIIKPIVDTYFETANTKRKDLETQSIVLTEKYSNDDALINKSDQLQEKLFAIERGVNEELKELENEEYDIDIKQIKLSSFMIDPKGDPEDTSNWRDFKGDHLDFLSWLIIDDIDGTGTVDETAIQTLSMEDAVEDVVL